MRNNKDLKYFAEDGEEILIDDSDNSEKVTHVIDKNSILAVECALRTQRPLLIKGEPGIGKSQLAQAVAKKLGWAFIPEVITAHSESQDLLWRFDAVGRLGAAQAGDEERKRPDKFLSPGPLWWAFDPDSARVQYSHSKKGLYVHPFSAKDMSEKKTDGCVVLIDEIDKTDIDFANGLLEVFGNRTFPVPFCQSEGSPLKRRFENDHVTLKNKQRPPLMVITTNGERELPDPFVRRCWVLELALPKDEIRLKKHLLKVGKAHFDRQKIHPDVYQAAIKQLINDRKSAHSQRIAAPGQAEYLDTLKALTKLAPGDKTGQLNLLRDIGRFSFGKHQTLSASSTS